jgi:RND family efflux transporter MFP subunit
MLLGCQSQSQPPPTEVLRPVRVERAEQSGGAVKRRFSGTLKPGTETKVSFKVGGTVTELQLKVGDKVGRSQVIAKLEARDQSLQAQGAAASVRQVQAELSHARAQYGRIKALYENNNATRADLDQARTAFESAQAGLAAAKKQLELAQAQAGKTVLRAPVEGVVASVEVEPGENVNPGQPVVVLNSGSEAEVEIAVPEQLVAQVKVGLPVTVLVDALKGKRLGGTVSEVGVTTGHTATTYPVTATLSDSNDAVRPGMAAEVELELGDSAQAPRVHVNPKAVREDREGRYVYIAEPQGEGLATVQRKAVKVGEITASGLEVLEGVAAGDWVVTAGLTYLSPGKRVRLPKSATGQSTDPRASGSARTEPPKPVPATSAAGPRGD